MKIKASKNFSFKKASGLLLGIVADTLNDMIKYQNSAIQDGIKTSTDINGDSFEKLSEDSTLPIRVKRGHGFTPLFTMKKGSFGAIGADIQSGKSLRATKIIPANKKKLVSKLRMVNKHGIYHNQEGGFQSRGMIKGKTVPQREWFGISKEMKPGGNKYKAFMIITKDKLKRSFRL